jgi:hypothetical protein
MMTEKPLVLVLGSIGNVGKAVSNALLKSQISCWSSMVEGVRVDFEDFSSFPEPLKGCDAVFLMRPPCRRFTTIDHLPFQ